MTKKDGPAGDPPKPPAGDPPNPPADDPPKPPKSDNPTPENETKWQEHVEALRAQLTSLLAEVRELRERPQPQQTDLKPLETELAETKAALATATQTLQAIQTELKDNPPRKRGSDDPPAPKPKTEPKPKRPRAAWV